MTQTRTVINVLSSPWVGIARDDAMEWWRDHHGAPLEEFDDWVKKVYEPHILRSAFGITQPGQRMTGLQLEALDDVHEGLFEAALRFTQARRVDAA